MRGFLHSSVYTHLLPHVGERWQVCVNECDAVRTCMCVCVFESMWLYVCHFPELSLPGGLWYFWPLCLVTDRKTY